MAKADLSAARLRELLSYDTETGIFRWKKRVSNVAADSVAGTTKKGGYIQIGIDKNLHLGHQLAWLYVHGNWPKNDVDHINGISSDNRIANLRDVTRLVNMQNQRKPQKHNSTGFLGVTYSAKDMLFRAKIRLPGKKNPTHIGAFRSAEEAHQAYLEAKRMHHSGCTI